MIVDNRPLGSAVANRCYNRMSMNTELASFPETLEARLDELRDAREGLLRELEPFLSNSAPNAQPAGWCAGEIAYHAHLTENSIVRLLRKFLAAPERHPPAAAAQLRAEWERIRRVVGIRDTPMQAPARVVPRDAPALAEALPLLHQSRQELLALVESVPYGDLLSISMAHPFQAVGVITGAGWLSVVAYHELRHSEQIRELGAAVSQNGPGSGGLDGF
jgi:DinB superfamily